MITGAAVWGSWAALMAGVAVWKTAEWVHTVLQARREARTHLTDASLDRFLEQAARDSQGHP